MSTGQLGARFLKERPIIQDAVGAELYGIKAGKDYRVPVGAPGGLAEHDRVATLELGQAAGQLGYATKADMEGDLDHDAGTLALVTNDPTPANNGTYRKTGASGEGAWVASADRVSALEARTAAVEATVAAIGEEFATYIQRDAEDIAEGGYPAALSLRAPTQIRRVFAQVLRGNGSLTLNVLVNGAQVLGPLEVEAGAALLLDELEVDLVAGDSLSFDLADVDDVQGIWIQADGGSA